MDYSEMQKYMDKARIMVIGDFILDQYVYTYPVKISPEAPVLTLKKQNEEYRLGGALNVVNNILSLGGKVVAIGLIGQDPAGRIIDKLASSVDRLLPGYFMEKELKTTLKCRIVSQDQQVVRIDDEEKYNLSLEMESKIIATIKHYKKDYDTIIISDYNKGVITDRILKYIRTLKKVKVFVDPKGNNYKKYKKFYLITPNLNEFKSICNIQVESPEELIPYGRQKVEQLKLEHLIITLGAKGLLLINKEQAIHIPAVSRDVYDVSGAGDTFIASLALAIARNLDIVESCKFANNCAGVVVEKSGTSIVNFSDLYSKQTNVLSLVDLRAILLEKKINNQSLKIVFTNGCFDILHQAHISCLNFAKSQGDLLVVGINSDKSVKINKGDKRPLMPEQERGSIISKLSSVDYVVIFNEETPIKIIETINPDIIVKGGDYKEEDVVGKEHIESYGGQIVLFPYVNNKSTTNIINNVLRTFI